MRVQRRIRDEDPSEGSTASESAATVAEVPVADPAAEDASTSQVGAPPREGEGADESDRRVEKPPKPARHIRSTRVMVRNVGPLSVLRFCLLYYFCVMLVLFLAFVIMYSVLDSAGALQALGRGLVNFGFGCSRGIGVPARGGKTAADCVFAFDRAWILSRVFTVGLVLVVLWSVVKVVVSLLYNLISDIVGGINVTLVERR